MKGMGVYFARQWWGMHMKKFIVVIVNKIMEHKGVS
jgi:hypothetical protein